MTSDTTLDVDSYEIDEFLKDEHEQLAPQKGEKDLEKSLLQCDTVEQSKPTGTPVQRAYRKASNTGPKGVRRDYEEAKLNLKGVKTRQKVVTSHAIKRSTEGPTLFTVDDNAKNEDTKEESKQSKESDKEKDDEDDDDEAFKLYKLQRLKDIKSTLPSYGTFKRVDFDEMSSVINTESEFVFVVVHLYQNYIEACCQINDAIEQLAPQFPHAHFIRIRSKEAISAYSDTGLSTLMIYRNKEMIHSFIRVQDQLKSKDIDERVLGRFLAEHGVLKIPNAFQSSTEEQEARSYFKSRPKKDVDELLYIPRKSASSSSSSESSSSSASISSSSLSSFSSSSSSSSVLQSISSSTISAVSLSSSSSSSSSSTSSSS
eukprot:TRINITY_DN1293_c0_g1_i1.p1 TRINITY_DN1293_c0_g1~~TRINITY_DN1293_c0_g1_i1.p1  ORF type:complete len:372 (-),score=137.07 TRINITY_DN1293_c0_g1_i1:310-1425(-)